MLAFTPMDNLQSSVNLAARFWTVEETGINGRNLWIPHKSYGIIKSLFLSLHLSYTFALLLCLSEVFCLSLHFSNATFTISCVNRPLSGPLSLFMTLCPVIRLQGEIGGGGVWRESCIIIQPYELTWSLTSFFAAACLNIIVVYDSVVFSVEGFFFFFALMSKELQETKSLHATKISLRPSLWRGGE